MPKEDAANLKFERVHRMPTKRSARIPTNKLRPIIAKLSFYKDNGRIFKHVKNIDPELKCYEKIRRCTGISLLFGKL